MDAKLICGWRQKKEAIANLTTQVQGKSAPGNLSRKYAMLTTAITDGFAMLRNDLMPNPNRGNSQHQFQTVEMQSNSGNMQNAGMIMAAHL